MGAATTYEVFGRIAYADYSATNWHSHGNFGDLETAEIWVQHNKHRAEEFIIKENKTVRYFPAEIPLP